MFIKLDIRSIFLDITWSDLGWEYAGMCLQSLLCCASTPQGFLSGQKVYFECLDIVVFQKKRVFVENSIFGSLICRDISQKCSVWTIRTVLVFGKHEI